MYNDPYENLTLHGGTPFVAEGSLNPDEDEITGTLAPVACKVLMKALWLARLARPDILKPIGDLASNVQKWSRNHDRQLLRLIQYLVGTCNHRLVGTVQDSADDLELVLYVDADLCGERAHTKSTSDGYLVLRGPQTWFPLEADIDIEVHDRGGGDQPRSFLVCRGFTLAPGSSGCNSCSCRRRSPALAATSFGCTSCCCHRRGH